MLRIIKDSRLHDEFAKQHSRAGSSLKLWRTKTRYACWKKPADVKRTHPSADHVTLPNGLQVTVFDIGGNAFRLITVIHYNRGIVYIRKFMTHAEYSKGDWKNDP